MAASLWAYRQAADGTARRSGLVWFAPHFAHRSSVVAGAHFLEIESTTLRTLVADVLAAYDRRARSNKWTRLSNTTTAGSGAIATRHHRGR